MAESTRKLNPEELVKQKKDGLAVLDDLLRYSDQGDYSAIDGDDLSLFKWFGVYKQKPNTGHFMVRVKIPGGQLTPSQLEAISNLAHRFGRGFGDITTRQDIQLHWVTLADLRPILERLERVKLNTQFACGDTPRNVVSCPLAGVLEDEIIDATPQVRAVSAMFQDGGRAFSNLPRKFKTSIGGCGLHCHQPQINDIGLYGARRADGEAGYGLLVGGGLRDTPHFAQPMRVFVRPEQVVEVCRAIAKLFHGHGYRDRTRLRARLKFLVADMGWPWTRDRIEENLGYHLERDETLLHPPAVHADHMGVSRQKDGRFFVGVPIERGRLTSRSMGDLAHLAAHYSDTEGRIRLSNKQNAILLDIPEKNVEPLMRCLTENRMPPKAHPLRASLVSCTGTEFCNLAVVETKQRAASILRYLEEHTTLDRPLMVSVTGCPNACAQYQIADIGLTGIPVVLRDQKDADGKPLKVDGYNILLGGRLGTDPRFGEVIARKIRADLVHLSIASLVNSYMAERLGPEEAFADWTLRCDPEYLRKLAEEAAKHPDAVPLPA